MAELWPAEIDPYFEREKTLSAVLRKVIRPQVSKLKLFKTSKYFDINELILNDSNLENCGHGTFRNTALFLLATRVLPASLNFG